MNKSIEESVTSTNTQVTTVCAKELRGEAGCKEMCDECKRKKPKETMTYVETPISEKPEKEGRYIVNNGLGFFEVSWNEHYGFHEEFTDCSGLTYWLKPVEGADAGAEYGYSLALPRIKELEQENERLREAVKKAEESEVDTPDLCDVDGCEMEAASGGCAWRESGYWCVCLDHSARARAGSPQPFMKKSATDREKSRLPDGRLPTQALAGKKDPR